MMTHHWPVVGHDWAVDHLRKGLVNNRIRHAYLITGVESVGKETLAQAFAGALNCTHPDEAARPCGECRSCRLIASGNSPDIVYSESDPNTGVLKIEEIRSVTQRLALKPYEARYRVAILRDFDHAPPRAQDALLKTLEEPAPHAVLILLALTPDALLSTITSRSQMINLRPVPTPVIAGLLQQRGAEPDQAELIAHFSGGRPGWAIRALENPEVLEQRAQALDLLEDCLVQNRANRFNLAESLAPNKLALYPLLELWQTYLRDLVHLCSGEYYAPANADRAETLQRLAGQMDLADVLAALKATHDLLSKLSLNINTRLALEVMFLDYPGLTRQ
jgi:DNA polymerase-3 subunit delta'